MDRRRDSRYARRIALLTAATAVILAPAPVAIAAEPAADEYTLEIPGIRDSALEGASQVAESQTASPVDQAGVAGETGSASSPLESFLSALGEAPLAIAIILLALAGIAITAGRSLREPRTG